MASVTAVTASPVVVAPHGGTCTITPTVTNASSTFTGTVFDDTGGSASVVITVAGETLTYTVDATKKGLPGFITLVLSPPAAGTIAVAANGTSFTFTAA